MYFYKCIVFDHNKNNYIIDDSYINNNNNPFIY